MTSDTERTPRASDAPSGFSPAAWLLAPGESTTLPVRLSPWSGGSFASPEPVRVGPWRDDGRGVDDGYSGASLVTGLGLGLARASAAVALPLPALAAALAVVAGLAGLEGVDLAAADLVDDARLGGMALKSNLLVGTPNKPS